MWLGRRRSRRTANAKRRPGYGALTVSIVPRVFAFLWEVSPALFLTLIVILLFNAFAPAAMAWLSMKVIVDGVVEATTSGSGWMALTVPVAAVFAIWVVNAGLASADVVVRRLLQQKTEILESVKLLNKAGTLDVAFFETPRFYDQLHQAVQQRWTVHYVANQSLGLLQRVVSLTAMLSLLSVLHPIAIVVLPAGGERGTRLCACPISCRQVPRLRQCAVRPVLDARAQDSHGGGRSECPFACRDGGDLGLRHQSSRGRSHLAWRPDPGVYRLDTVPHSARRSRQLDGRSLRTLPARRPVFPVPGSRSGVRHRNPHTASHTYPASTQAVGRAIGAPRRQLRLPGFRNEGSGATLVCHSIRREGRACRRERRWQDHQSA